MAKPIVVGVDGSRESSAAAHWAAREALRRGLPLRLVHAWEGLPEPGTQVRLPELSAPQYRARGVLRSVSAGLLGGYPTLSVSTEQVKNSPVPALLAESASAELLVLGSQGLGSVSGVLAGSVALAAAAHAACPLVLVRAAFTRDSEHLSFGGAAGTCGPLRDVALAVDLRQPSGAVTEFAFHAAELWNAPLRVVHAWHVPLRKGLVGRDERAAAKECAETGLAAALSAWRATFPKVPVREVVVEGRPVHHVPRAAAGAGLLVVGRRSRPAALGPHTGAVTHAVIHHVGCPVAVVAHE
ncbi:MULTISPECIES: universal stress protein [unclassified Streptomyces]|uniref:universal stress protein n=1 Tax=unclassified Streptomyces TaxID=2593676 RepID=UPI00278C268F|nr:MULTISPECIES: universal stress protein [unclassified Streptomyces]